MKLPRALKSIFNAVAAQIPVIGPHAGIEPALLLSGHKRLGWIPALTDPEVIERIRGEARREYDIQKELDDAVAAGKLKSLDVVYKQQGNFLGGTVRHYCQPQFEEEMRLIARINEKLFNREQPDEKLGKSFGDYLGYRKRDQLLWKILPDLPRPVQDAIYALNRTVAQPAYQQHMLHKAGRPDFKPIT